MKNTILAAIAALLVPGLPSIAQCQDINLTGYTLTFDDEFNSLSLTTTSPKGSKTWFAGPPNGSPGDFSSSNWNINAFSVSGGILSDTAYYVNPAINGQNWQSGLIASVDPTKAGFSQQYGYFEIRCQMPNAGQGAWPAFWLDSTTGISGGQNEEIDIFEWYGVTNTPGSDQPYIQEASHNWNADGSQNQSQPYLYSPQTTMPGGAYPWQGYHIYGCQIDASHITWYIDGVQTNQIATPTTYVNSGPFYVMVDYALGGGWSLTGTPFTADGNSSLLVDWVRVYSLPSSSTHSIGMQFQGSGTALAPSDSAGLSTVAQSNWNVLTGASFSNQALSDSTGVATTAKLSGSANGTYFASSSSASPAGNTKLASGELYNTWPGAPTLSVTNIPFPKYDVYVYAAIDATGRSETVELTPSGGTAKFYSFTTEGGGSAWTAATSTWNGSGTAPSLPSANYVHYTGLTATSFTLAWGAPGNGGMNGIEIVPTN